MEAFILTDKTNGYEKQAVSQETSFYFVQKIITGISLLTRRNTPTHTQRGFLHLWSAVSKQQASYNGD